MIELQTGSAATAGFGVIGRNVGSVMIWGLMLLLLAVVPVLMGLPTLAGVFRNPAGAQDAGEALGASTVYQVANVAFSLIGAIFLQAAVFRAVLQPENRGFAYLRFGREELLLFVWLVILIAGAIAIMFVFGAAAGAVSYLVGRDSGPAIVGLTMAVLSLAAVPLVIWLLLRLILVGPTIVATGRLDIRGAWALTKGRVGGLFAVWLMNLLLVIALVIGVFLAIILVFGVVAAAAGVMFGSAFTPGQAPDTGAALAVGIVLIAVGLVAFLLYFWVLAALQAVGLAPWADVYKQLTQRDVAQTFA